MLTSCGKRSAEWSSSSIFAPGDGGAVCVTMLIACRALSRRRAARWLRYKTVLRFASVPPTGVAGAGGGAGERRCAVYWASPATSSSHFAAKTQTTDTYSFRVTNRRGSKIKLGGAITYRYRLSVMIRYICTYNY